jgi:hypothetical protein
VTHNIINRTVDLDKVECGLAKIANCAHNTQHERS